MTFREKLERDYPHTKGQSMIAIGCPHNWDYCDHADTVCGRAGRANRNCQACWAQTIKNPTPDRIEYTDDNGQSVTNCIVYWFVHTYTRKAMCVVRVEYESGGVEHETLTKEEFIRRWDLSK